MAKTTDVLKRRAKVTKKLQPGELMPVGPSWRTVLDAAISAFSGRLLAYEGRVRLNFTRLASRVKALEEDSHPPQEVVSRPELERLGAQFAEKLAAINRSTAAENDHLARKLKALEAGAVSGRTKLLCIGYRNGQKAYVDPYRVVAVSKSYEGEGLDRKGGARVVIADGAPHALRAVFVEWADVDVVMSRLAGRSTV